MINWILGGIFVIWIMINRFGKDGKIEDQPLGLPRGTVRALITILIVSFPFTYLIFEQDIPGLILNIIFILIAFYYEARKTEKEKLGRIIKEIKGSDELIISEKKAKYPLYLPKYSVRILLLSILILTITINEFGPKISFESKNTLIDILIIMALFVIGLIIRGIKNYQQNLHTKEKIRNMKDYQNLSDIEIVENLMNQKHTWFQKTGRSILSLFMLGSVISALFLFQFDLDPRLLIFDITIPIRESLLLLTNFYFGFRD